MVKNRKGIALLMVIGFIIMLLVLGGATLVISVGHFGTSHAQLERSRAFYAAEAALQRALWKCRVGPPNGYDLSLCPISDNLAGQTIEGIDGSNIQITIYPPNLGTEPEGVHPIAVTVNY